MGVDLAASGGLGHMVLTEFCNSLKDGLSGSGKRCNIPSIHGQLLTTAVGYLQGLVSTHLVDIRSVVEDGHVQSAFLYWGLGFSILEGLSCLSFISSLI